MARSASCCERRPPSGWPSAYIPSGSRAGITRSSVGFIDARSPARDGADGSSSVSAAPAVQGGRSLSRAAGGVSLAVLASRILGLVREVAFTSLFGASRELDAFIAAFRIPNLLRDLFAE